MKKPANRSEAEFWEAATSNGWTVEKRGWPDFACWKDGKFIVVEVKPNKHMGLKSPQWAILKALAKAGIPAYRWTPDGGFRKILPSGYK